MVVPQSIYRQFKGTLTDEQFYIIHLLVRKLSENNNSPEYFHFSIRLLEKQIGRDARASTIQPLLDLGIIDVQSSTTSNESYSAGQRSKGYRLNDLLRREVKNDQLTTYWCPQDSRLSRRLKRNRIGMRMEALKGLPKLQREYDWLCRINIDKTLASQYREQFEHSGKRGSRPYTKLAAIRLESDVYALSRLRTEEFLFTFNNVRLTTAVTMAMREIRKCLVDSAGQYFVELDLRASQIVFLCKALTICQTENINKDYYGRLMSQVNKDVDIFKHSSDQYTDIAAFIRRVLMDDIYSEFYFLEDNYLEGWTQESPGVEAKSSTWLANSRFRTKDRSEYKKKVLKDILFNYYTRKKSIPTVARAVEEAYPNVIRIIETIANESINRKRSADLANVTQVF